MTQAGEAVRAAVLVVPSKIELRTFPRPRIGLDDALLQIEADRGPTHVGRRRSVAASGAHRRSATGGRMSAPAVTWTGRRAARIGRAGTAQ